MTGTIPLSYFLALSTILFVVGMIGVLTKRSALLIFMCVELMMNAVNISLVAFGRFWSGYCIPVVGGPANCSPNYMGQSFVVFTITIAAAEAAVGLAIIVALARHRQTIDVSEVHSLKQ